MLGDVEASIDVGGQRIYQVREARPMRTPEQMQMRYAQTFGAVKAIEDLSLRERDTAAASREQWPELWAKLDRLFRLLHD